MEDTAGHDCCFSQQALCPAKQQKLLEFTEQVDMKGSYFTPSRLSLSSPKLPRLEILGRFYTFTKSNYFEKEEFQEST